MLDALGVERAHVVGHDWGAAVAWQVAARHPDRVRSLTAVSVPHPVAFSEALRSDPDQRERSQYMRLFQVEGKAEEVLLRDDDGRGLRELLRRRGGHRRRRALPRGDARAGAADGLPQLVPRDGPGHRRRLPPVTVPTLYVWSDGDLALGRTAAEATAAHVEGPYRFVELDGVSHWIPEEVPEVLAACCWSTCAARSRRASREALR